MPKTKDRPTIVPATPGYSLLEYDAHPTNADYDTVREYPIVAWAASELAEDSDAPVDVWGTAHPIMVCVPEYPSGLRQPDGTVVNLGAPGIVYPDRGYWLYKQLEIANMERADEARTGAKAA